MTFQLRNKSNYLIIDENDEAYELYVVTDYERSFPRSIVIKESATGDGGVVYDNGRTQESVPINGQLLGSTPEEVNDKKNKLIKLQGQAVDFITNKFNMGDVRSNKFFIQNITFTPNNESDLKIPFNMTLQEKRDANIKEVAVNLVNYEPSETLINIAKTNLAQEE